MQKPVENANLLRQSCESPVGRLSLAGTIRDSSGISFRKMRILGSYAMVYLLAGSGRYADQRGNRQKVRAGDLLTLYPDIGHAYGPGPGEAWSEIFLVFDGPVFDLYRQHKLLDEARPVGQLSPVDYWLGRIQSVPASVGKESALQSICKLQLLIAEMRDYQQASATNQDDRAWLARAKVLLEQNLSGPNFDLETIADQLDSSYVGFRKKFVRLAGVSPGRFRTRAVMQRAVELLREPESCNRKIASQLGFCDEFHFSRRFKQAIGLSPREFLKQMPRPRK